MASRPHRYPISSPWAMSCGRRSPDRSSFTGATDLDIFKKIRKCEVPPLVELRPDIPPSFANIVNKTLARDPGDRFPSARIMAKAIVASFKDVDWHEDAHTELGEMVSRIRNGRRIHTHRRMQTNEPSK